MPTFNPTPFDPAKPETQPAIPTTADQRGQHSNGNTAFTAAYADVDALETTVSGHVADGAIHFTEASITHNNVGGRSTADAHPTSAITGLDAALLSKIENVIEDTTPQLGGDLETKGNEIVLTRADDTVHGALLAEETLGGAALYYTVTASAYDFLDGAVQVGPGHATLHGTVARVSSLSHTESTRQQVYADQAGGLYAVEEPPAGWTVEDTDAADYDLGAPGTGTGTWIQLTGLVINTGGALTTGQRVDIAVTLSVVNKASNRSGLIEIYYGVDGGVPGALDVDDTSPVSQGFAGQLTLGGLEISDADYSSGIPITIWARAAGGSGNGYGLDLVGSVIAPHRLIVSVASGGTGGASPLTTKGDVYTYSTVDARLPVGANGTLLTANSATSTGLEWTVPVGTGDVVGPASAVNNNLATFNGTTGKVIQDGNVIVSNLVTAAIPAAGSGFIWTTGGADKSAIPSSTALTNLATAAANLATGNVVIGANNDKSISDSSVPLGSVILTSASNTVDSDVGYDGTVRAHASGAPLNPNPSLGQYVQLNGTASTTVSAMTEVGTTYVDCESGVTLVLTGYEQVGSQPAPARAFSLVLSNTGRVLTATFL